MSKELVVLSPYEIIESGVSGFNEKDLPEMIQEQIRELNELEKRVNKAMYAADEAKNSAMSAKDKSAGFGKKKIAIEELQSAGIDLAEAVQSGAEAQKISFEFQTKLAKISKYLFGLGVTNIASNRFVVRELEMRLKGASQEELSELARQELMTVVKQLKEKEDIHRKLDSIFKIIKIHDESLNVQSQKNQQIDEQLQAQAEVDKLQYERLRIHAETGKIFKEQLEAQAGIVKVQGEQLKIQSENIEKLDEQLAALQEKNNDLTVQIMGNLKTIEAQEIKINMLKDEITNLKILLDSKANNTLSKITLAIAIIAFVAFVIQFFFIKS